MREIYLDNNATTAPDEAVVEAMLASLRRAPGNPSSLHPPGEAAAAALEAARGAVARLVGARSPREIVFTSGGTEANHTALHAALGSIAPAGRRRRVLTSPIEHAGLLRPLEAWAHRAELEVELAALDPEGAIDTDRLLKRIDTLGAELALVSVMWANNETGVLLPDEALGAVAAACRRHGVPFHVDAVQAPGKVPMDVAGLGIDLASLSAHKFHGPQGVGALYVRAGFEEAAGFPPFLAGGGQEHDRRAGTPNGPGIAGLGRAAELALAHLDDGETLTRIRSLRDRLEEGLREAVPGARVIAAGALRLPNTASIRFPGTDGELLLQALGAEGIAASAGAACSATKRGTSHVLTAMGLDEAAAGSCLRFSLSRRTTATEVDETVTRVGALVAALTPLQAP